jgi:2-amino-4-hydroxy-6-hydroxymethyldihydropteridine diphosphokinase
MHYLIALGSNQRHGRFGGPRVILAAALERLDRKKCRVRAASPVVQSAPLGPSARTYANACALVETKLMPEELLDRLQRIEDKFGRNRRGQRWRARTLDLDIIFWSGGIWSSPRLSIPHPRFRDRDFVLRPAVQIAGEWREPLSGLSLRHLLARLDRKRPRA